MARVIKMYQVGKLSSKEDEEVIKDLLKEYSGITRVNPISKFGILEIEYEEALVNRETIANVLKEKGYELK
ncbi:MAG: hypothetical protein FXF54_13040 [Kosmotoga sp.]|nr:MAG: hypothetical protein FXF54_13040 [Kosmotoga sp.]